MIRLLCFLLFFSCNEKGDYVFYDNPPRIQKSDRSYPLRNILQDAKIDILWVVDNSGSMQDIQNNIVNNAALFMQEFTQNNIMKWRMGVMSTDKSELPYLGYTTTFDGQSADPIKTFQDAISALGTNGDVSEYVFYNVNRGVGMATPYDQFYRRDSHLAVIMVTDEEEQSKKRFGSQFEAVNFLDSLRAMKSPEKIIRFYGAFQFPDLQDCSGWGDTYADSPFEKIINMTDGIHMSACVSDFGTRMAEIGRDIVSIIDTPRIMLRKRPVIKTLEVFFDDQKLPGGKESEGGYWYYSKYFNTINFYNLDFAPDLSTSDIRIKYDVDDGYDHDEWRE
jgi:hypothetical protein